MLSVSLTAARRHHVALIPAILLLLGLCVLSLFSGARPIAPAVVWQALTDFDPANSEHLLVCYLRLPRTLLAVVVGGALGGAGVIMQTLTRNPLADPGLLGVNAGATLAIVLAIALFNISDIYSTMWFGMTGAALVSLAVFLLGGLNGDNPVRIVLAGAALTIVLLCLTQIVIVNSHADAFDRFRHWVVGSLQGRGFDVLFPVSLLVLCGLLLAIISSNMLDIASLGPDASRALGVDPRWLAGLSALIVVILAGGATAAAGPLGFIGLTAPHVARTIAGPGHRWLLPWAVLFSAMLVLVADILGRTIGYPGEISVGIMVALIGGPFFMLLVKRWTGERL